MPWTYHQNTGQLAWHNQKIGVGYSGLGSGRNNPNEEKTRNVGPIPRGRYRIGPAHTHRTKGPWTMTLTPNGHTAHGRTAFLVHGDSRTNPGNASEGCIVLPPDIRIRMARSGDTVLEVVE